VLTDTDVGHGTTFFLLVLAISSGGIASAVCVFALPSPFPFLVSILATRLFLCVIVTRTHTRHALDDARPRQRWRVEGHHEV